MRSLGDPRTTVTASVLAVSACTALLLGSLAWARAQSIEPALLFLDSHRAPTADEAAYAILAEHSRDSQQPLDVLFIGDSACSFGIDPAPLERLTKLRSFNSGLTGSMGPDSFRLLLDNYLSHEPKPRLVVLCVSPFLCGVEAAAIDQGTGARLLAAYGQSAASWGDRARFLAQRGALGLLDPGIDTRGLPIDGAATKTYWKIQTRLRRDRGFNRNIAGRASGAVPAGPVICDEWRRGVDRIAQSCARARTPLLVIFAPIDSELVASREWRALDEWADDFQSRHHGVRVERPIVVGYPANELWDATKLNPRGVEHFMPAVARKVENAWRDRATRQTTDSPRE
jgi:hypothetical protein